MTAEPAVTKNLSHVTCMYIYIYTHILLLHSPITSIGNFHLYTGCALAQETVHFACRVVTRI